LDAAAREEHNWEAGKDDIPVPLPAPAPEDDDVILLAPPPLKPPENLDLQEPSEQDNHRVQEKQFKKTLDKLQQLYEQDLPRAAKKPRKTITPSFTIPFNKPKGEKSGKGDYVELTNLTVKCGRQNEEFYANITEGRIFFSTAYNSTKLQYTYCY
jgi:hypothetical protein